VTSASVVAGTSGDRLRTGSASNVMSVVFITTAALAWRAKPGRIGRAITDMTLSAVSGTCFGRSVRPLRASRWAAISVKPRFCGPSTDTLSPMRWSPFTARQTNPATPDLYDLLIARRHWPLSRYGRFIADSMIAALLP
jgi:hypothetical protein